jgi:hypothetical protein
MKKFVLAVFITSSGKVSCFELIVVCCDFFPGILCIGVSLFDIVNFHLSLPSSVVNLQIAKFANISFHSANSK